MIIENDITYWKLNQITEIQFLRAKLQSIMKSLMNNKSNFEVIFLLAIMQIIARYGLHTKV